MLKFFRFGVILCLFAFSCGIVSAQQTLGSINGTAKDNSGGTVSGVTVKVRDLGTNYTRTAIAKEDGSFSIRGAIHWPGLPRACVCGTRISRG